MRKVSLLLGSLGGALAGYLLSNDKLRKALKNAKNAEEAAKTLGAHLSEDGKQFAKEVKTFVESDEFQKNLGKAKTFTTKKFGAAQKGFKSMVKKGSKSASKMVKKGTKRVKEMM